MPKGCLLPLHWKEEEESRSSGWKIGAELILLSRSSWESVDE